MLAKYRRLLLEITPAFFILLFVYTAISKLLSHRTFTLVLQQSPLIGKMAPLISWLVPLVELSIATFLFIPSLRQKGLMASFLLMTIFTLYIGYMLLFTTERPCSCGGVLEWLSWKGHLIFNLFCSLLGLAGYKLKYVINDLLQ